MAMHCYILGLAYVVALTITALPGVEGLNCNYGDTVQSISRPCPGSCLTINISSGKLLMCLPQRMPDTCKSMYGMTMCFCNTDDCNKGKATSAATTFIEFMAGSDTGTDTETVKGTSTGTDMEKASGLEDVAGTKSGISPGDGIGMLFRFVQYQMQNLVEKKM